MKIDIHAHTKKVKSGEVDTRNINPDRLCEILKLTEVGILAITNHNHFDLEQYNSINEKCNKFCQIWPGIELDVIEEKRKGHVIIIINPSEASEFYKQINELLDGTSAEDFNISIQELIDKFNGFDSVFIPHYYAKKPSLNDFDINKLESLLTNKNRLIKEATNAISAGIYVSHGHKTIYGSDIHDWDNYQIESKELPDLRLPVESFEKFCLLLEKDETTIKTILKEKHYEELNLKPFDSEDTVNINIYNDINVLFGPKGTGKSDILKAISKHYQEKGEKANVYESNKEDIKNTYDIRGDNLQKTLIDFNLTSCKKNIRRIKKAEEINITNISKYKDFFSKEISNKNANRILIKDYQIEDYKHKERELQKISNVSETIKDFIEFCGDNQTIADIIDNEILNNLKELLNTVKNQVHGNLDNKYVELKESHLFKNMINIFNKEIHKKIGHPEKPSGTGFKGYASNRIKIEIQVNEIIDGINSEIESESEYVGNLGDKGELYCKTEYLVQDGKVHSGEYKHMNSSRKTPQKEFSKCIFEIKKSLYSVDLFEKITNFKEIDELDIIKDIDDLVLFRKIFTIDQDEYNPSSGESSMLLLHKELNKDQDIYLLDEPEKSLGNDYISEVIVPILKEKARLGKRIVIATHDANIAVRTLPYNSIYRQHEMKNYKTYVGNPFNNNLVDTNSSENVKEWKNVSMKTLEGGKEAFGERGKIYGNKEM